MLSLNEPDFFGMNYENPDLLGTNFSNHMDAQITFGDKSFSWITIPVVLTNFSFSFFFLPVLCNIFIRRAFSVGVVQS